MKCPKCDQAMEKVQWNLLTNQKTKGSRAKHDTYERTLFVCEADDTWVTIEQPVSK